MINGEGRRISAFEAVVFTTAATFATGIFIAPRILVADAAEAGGVALLLAYALSVGWAAALSCSAGRLPDHSIARSLMLRAPYLGYPWLVMVVLAELVFASGGLAAYQDMATAVAMPGFSGLSITILLALGAWTGARHRLVDLGRAVLIFFGSFSILALLSFLFLLLRGSELAAVVPRTGINVSSVLRADVDTLFLFSGFGALALTLPHQVHRGRGLPHIALGAAVTGFLTILAYTATVGTVGPAYVLTLTWPVVSALRTLVVHSFFLDRFGLVVVFAWSAIVITFVAIHLWAAGEAVIQMIGRERGRGWWTLVFAGAVMVFAARTSGPIQEEILARSVEGPVTGVILAGWLLAAIALALLARRRALPQ